MRQRAPDAIGGITRSNARSVIDAGAGSVAVISDLVADPPQVGRRILVDSKGAPLSVDE